MNAQLHLESALNWLAQSFVALWMPPTTLSFASLEARFRAPCPAIWTKSTSTRGEGNDWPQSLGSILKILPHFWISKGGARLPTWRQWHTLADTLWVLETWLVTLQLYWTVQNVCGLVWYNLRRGESGSEAPFRCKNAGYRCVRPGRSLLWTWGACYSTLNLWVGFSTLRLRNGIRTYLIKVAAWWFFDKEKTREAHI